MKLKNALLMTLVGLSTASCGRSNSGFPENPVEGQQYRDSGGNMSMWNAALGCWMISSMVNGRSTQHHYYPSSNTYRDPGTNNIVPRPAHLPAASSRTSPSVNSRSTPNHSSGKASTSSRGSNSRGAGFGSTGRGSSSGS